MYYFTKVRSFEDISISRNTIAGRIDDMANDLKDQMITISSKCVYYSLAVDETVDIRGVAQLAVYIRGCDHEFSVCYELLQLAPM